MCLLNCLYQEILSLVFHHFWYGYVGLDYCKLRKSLITYNLGQNIVKKFTKSSNIGFSNEYLTAVFFGNFAAQLLKFAAWVSSWLLSHQFQVFQIFPWNFLISQDLTSYVVRQLVYWHFEENSLVSFQLWWTDIVLKCEKVD